VPPWSNGEPGFRRGPSWKCSEHQDLYKNHNVVFHHFIILTKIVTILQHNFKLGFISYIAVAFITWRWQDELPLFRERWEPKQFSSLLQSIKISLAVFLSTAWGRTGRRSEACEQHFVTNASSISVRVQINCYTFRFQFSLVYCLFMLVKLCEGMSALSINIYRSNGGTISKMIHNTDHYFPSGQ
jgi:hypothetical protein